ncbi:MAG: PQQ-dependent sugar dehydrogenase [Planctomycetota bacterium]
MLLAFALALALPQSTLQLELVADTSDGLVDPISCARRAGAPYLYLVERGGQVRRLVGGQLDTTPILDVSTRLALTVSTGLRAIAFHPDYATNGELYLWYDAPSTSGAIVDIVLARMTRSSAQTEAMDPASLTEVLREPQDNFGHACGSLDFGPDGYLYATLGDGGNPQDPTCNGQNPSNLMGCMLRLDVDQTGLYAVPPDNPFIGVPGYRPEICHLGFRHPWKWAFDRATGELWIADVGQANREEIDLVPPGVLGLNFGWKVMEGSTCFSTSNCSVTTPPCFDPAYTLPLYEYGHGVDCSITGGLVYRGTSIPDLVGVYLFSDFCSGRTWSLSRDLSGTVTVVERTSELTQAVGGEVLTAPVSFGEDGSGELYIIDYADKELFRIVRREDIVPFCISAPNASGVGARLIPTGTSSIAANDLILSARGLNPNAPALLYYGGAPTQIAQGNGFQCVTSGGRGIYRLAPSAAGTQGALSQPLDLTQPPLGAGPGMAVAGSTWVFQCWYRDVNGPLGQTSNYSDALSIRFRP